MKRELTDVDRDRSDPGDLASLVAFIEAEPDQDRRADGVFVSVILANRGEREIELMNPIDMLQFEVLDDRGFPVKLPTRAPNVLVNTRGGEWELRGPAPIVAVWKGSEEVDESAIDHRSLTLPPGTGYTVAFALARVVDAGGGESPVPDGRYRVGAIMTLIDARDPTRSRVLRSPAVELRFTARE